MNDLLISKISNDSYKINSSKREEKLITMNQFRSFLTFEVEYIADNHGRYNGWTEFRNEDMLCFISGGIYNGVNYLHQIEFGSRLHNKYNNFVNAFYLWEHLTAEGKVFFINYHKEEILSIIREQSKRVQAAKEKLKVENENLFDMNKEYGLLLKAYENT